MTNGPWIPSYNDRNPEFREGNRLTYELNQYERMILSEMLRDSPRLGLVGMWFRSVLDAGDVAITLTVPDQKPTA